MPVTPLAVRAADPWWMPTIRDEAEADDRYWDARYDTDPDDEA